MSTLFFRLESNKRPMYEREAHSEFNPDINLGCYSCGGMAHRALDEMALSHDSYDSSNDSNHPCPSEEGLRLQRTIGDAICGFTSYKMFRNWFPFDEGLQVIKDESRIAVYRVIVPSMMEVGKCQAIASAKVLELVKVLPCDCTEEDINACVALL